MKYTIIAILFLITGSKGIAQTGTTITELAAHAAISSGQPSIQYNSNGSQSLHFYESGSHKWQTAAIIKNGSDTIEVMVPLRVHFIKIGNTVYQIVSHDPTIEEVKPKINIWNGVSPYIQFTPSDLTNPNLPVAQ